MPKLSNFFEVAESIREFVPDMSISKRVFIAKYISDLCRDGRTNISREGMQSIMYFLKVTHEISVYQYNRINDIILESEKLREVQYKEIGYQEKSDALLKMWIDDDITDAIYNRIMDRLNKKVKQ